MKKSPVLFVMFHLEINLVQSRKLGEKPKLEKQKMERNGSFREENELKMLQ